MCMRRFRQLIMLCLTTQAVAASGQGGPPVLADFATDSLPPFHSHEAVQFEAIPLVPDLDSWSWSFGDGSSSSLENPVHTYTEAGMYTVSLAVESASGGHSTVVKDDYVLIDNLMIEDDFDTPGESSTIWDYYSDVGILVSASDPLDLMLRFDMVTSTGQLGGIEGGIETGDIICSSSWIGGGETIGQGSFSWQIELSALDPAPGTRLTIFELRDATSQTLPRARLELRYWSSSYWFRVGALEVMHGSSGVGHDVSTRFSDWLELGVEPETLWVDFDWSAAANGWVRASFGDPIGGSFGALVLGQLNNESFGYDYVALGLIEVIGSIAGDLLVDDFLGWRFRRPPPDA